MPPCQPRGLGWHPWLTARLSWQLGGIRNKGSTGAVEQYDPASDIWTARTPKPTPVYEIQAIIISGKVYVPGGRLDDTHTSDFLEVYDPRQDVWSRGANLPEPRSAYGLINYEGQIFLFGGFDGQEYSAKVFIYDPLIDEWMEGQPLPTPRGI